MENELKSLQACAMRVLRLLDVTAPVNDILGVLKPGVAGCSVEGSHLAHAIYAMQAQETMVILNTAFRRYNGRRLSLRSASYTREVMRQQTTTEVLSGY